MKSHSPEEIGKRYNRIANSYEYNRSPTIGIDYFLRFFQSFDFGRNMSNSISILDVGCGTGLPLTKLLVSTGAKVTGIDISTEMLTKAKQMFLKLPT